MGIVTSLKKEDDSPLFTSGDWISQKMRWVYYPFRSRWSVLVSTCCFRWNVDHCLCAYFRWRESPNQEYRKDFSQVGGLYVEDARTYTFYLQMYRKDKLDSLVTHLNALSTENSTNLTLYVISATCDTHQ